MALLFTACTQTETPPATNTAATKAEDKRITDLRSDIKKIEPFFKLMGKPKPYDWLGSHHEPGQTFEEYINSNPTLPTGDRRTIYVLPLGSFTPQQKKIIDITAGYLEAFYGLPVKEMPMQALRRPMSAKDSRIIANPKGLQIRTGYVMHSILVPKLPADAAALIALTNEDLFPDDTTNFVFGEASLEDRVGVWSLARLGQNADYDTFLRRTLKIAAHETGHMFSMKHCTKYECVMSGTNYLGETDSRPIDACPECMAKIAWLSNVSPKDRYDRLAAFCRKNGLTKEADDFQRKSAEVKAVSNYIDDIHTVHH
ncbi:MAG: archaemetzincin [Candidatus Binatia bacterium]